MCLPTAMVFTLLLVRCLSAPTEPDASPQPGEFSRALGLLRSGKGLDPEDKVKNQGTDSWQYMSRSEEFAKALSEVS